MVSCSNRTVIKGALSIGFFGMCIWAGTLERSATKVKCPTVALKLIGGENLRGL